MNIDWSYALRQLPVILSYAGITLKIAVLAMMLTLALALAVTIIRYYKVPLLTPLVNVYIDIFRGTPLLTQLFFIYYGFAQVSPFFREMKAINAAILGLALNAAAYTTENMRSALEAVAKGQTEAGLACGMTQLQTMWYIVLPQAARIAVPVLTNDFIALLKNTSMAFTLGVREIMGQVSLIGNGSFKFFEAYLDAFIIYFCLSKIIGILQKYLERRLKVVGGSAQ
ncbi:MULTISPECIES: amino acid ABC transporter permease [unclassified Pyramidobacter]|uniref:amino acid ABC transporter permease n=1 Tax=unclassified Pyramidobacter TaxID=2632171 RepID=UPI000EA32B46|nr:MULTISPECIES: amino acid ABC transporter permease [unclassified Pyramidobacter]RKJ76614.1 amino acid ABC transporter permease [Pyramidobacter sp. CG50-2]WOL39636.1 amino acid ABC transporter permease [Pyramidobacter sp. YE332]